MENDTSVSTSTRHRNPRRSQLVLRQLGARHTPHTPGTSRKCPQRSPQQPLHTLCSNSARTSANSLSRRAFSEFKNASCFVNAGFSRRAGSAAHSCPAIASAHSTTATAREQDDPCATVGRDLIVCESWLALPHIQPSQTAPSTQQTPWNDQGNSTGQQPGLLPDHDNTEQRTHFTSC